MLVIECLIIHECGESRRKHGAVIRITALKSNRIISYRRKVLPDKTWPCEGFHLMCCNYFVHRFRKRRIEGKRGPLRLQGSHERDTLIIIWPETISMDGFI